MAKQRKGQFVSYRASGNLIKLIRKQEDTLLNSERDELKRLRVEVGRLQAEVDTLTRDICEKCRGPHR